MSSCKSRTAVFSFSVRRVTQFSLFLEEEFTDTCQAAGYRTTVLVPTVALGADQPHFCISNGHVLFLLTCCDSWQHPTCITWEVRWTRVVAHKVHFKMKAARKIQVLCGVDANNDHYFKPLTRYDNIIVSVRLLNKLMSLKVLSEILDLSSEQNMRRIYSSPLTETRISVVITRP
jgi:hypothetical protein